MVEVINVEDNMKLMAMVFSGVQYQEERYLIYCIRRDEQEVNIFVSRLLKNSMGNVIDHQFSNGEKEVISEVVQRILNKDATEQLEKDGFSLLKGVELEGMNYFNIESCYVATVPRSLIKECLIFYGLVTEALLNQPVVEYLESKSKFNKGFVSNIVLIIFGVFVIFFSVVVILQML